MQPNVLLVVLDSARARNTSLYGYERETTPFLSALAERSTLYTQARAPSIHSIASHVSMFTGLHVEEHEATRHTAQIDTTRTIWHDLARRGYATGLFTNNQIVSAASNLGDAFQTTVTPEYPTTAKVQGHFKDTPLETAYFRLYDRISEITGSDNSETTRANNGDTSQTALLGRLGDGIDAVAERFESDGPGYKSIYGGEFVEDFFEWEADQRGSWAACLNLMDPHSPYEPGEAFDQWADQRHWQAQEDKPDIRTTLAGEGWDRIEALEPLYDGGIRQADEAVSELVTGLEERGILEDTLLIVTSDHGEAFGEQSRLKPEIRLRGHKWGIPEVLTHVPLVVRYPGQTAARTEDGVVSLTDLPQMIDAVLDGVDPSTADPLRTDGPVLASTFRIPEKKRAKYGSIEGLDEYVGPWRAVYEDHDGTVRKYAQKESHYVTVEIEGTAATVLDRDAHDRVAEAYDDLADEEILTARSREIDDELEGRLEDLGYMR